MTTFEPKLTGQKAEQCDVLVIGGGPGGSAAAIRLVQAGLKVVVVEKERHPRFHVGESLLPFSLPMLEELGVLDRVREIGVFKPGAEFISPDGQKNTVFNFDRALLGGPGHAYQVRRETFDHLLFKRAGEVGAVTLEETTATVISCDDSGAVVATHGPGEAQNLYHADFLVDASGRSTVIARMQNEKKPDPRNTSAAIFGHFRDVPRCDGARGGNIRIYLNDKGWMWQIPISDEITSLGMVAPGDEMAARGNSIEAFFRERTSRNPEFAKLIEHATPVDRLHATGNFSYRSGRASGPGHIKVGDAYGFIDPIFSTGVHLALISAFRAADVVVKSRKNPTARARLLEAYDRGILRQHTYVSWFIYSIEDPAFRHMLLNPKDVLGIERAVISLLAGDFRPDFRLRARMWLFKLIRRVIATRTGAKGHDDA
ncbi:tryptophan 7-halogenase [Rhodobacteraceae bacterium NNCM2]|nr:tryptophan 7-halogenase [Coraliihabitans acroporae]